MTNIPISRIHGIHWPAIGDASAALDMSIQYQLEQSQWWSPEELLKRQFEQLGDLLNHTYKTVPFYRNLYLEKQFRPKRILDLEKWQQVPIVSRHMIQQAGPTLNSKQVPSQHGAASDITTSGSTGRPITVKSNQITQLFWRALNLRDHVWHKRDLSGRLAIVKTAKDGTGSPPNGTEAKSWGVATNGYKTGKSSILDISATLDQQIAWLEKFNPHYFLTYPSNLVALADHAKNLKWNLPNLKEIRTLGEIVSVDIRERCKETWEVKLADGYSCQEAGYLAIQCPEYDHYHVQSESILLEVLDENDLPCKSGETGRVVITSLHNYASPLVRYEIGDYAEVGETCPCGRGLPVLNRILGRVRNMITLPNGEKHWPFVGSSAYRDIADIQQFQLVQTKFDHLDVKLVTGEPLTKMQEQQLTEVIHQSTSFPFDISFIYLDEIPRGKNGKYEDFISEIS